MGCSVSKVVFQPPKPKVQPQYYLNLRTSTGRKIPAVFLNQEESYTLLISHGNAEDISHVLNWTRRFLSSMIRVNFMVYEYSGYSRTEGNPCENQVYADCEAALEYLLEVQRIPPKNIILYGRSLGTGPSCYLAEKHKDLGGMILQTPFTSVYRVMLNFRFTFPGDMFPNIDRINQVRIPVLIVHGTRDEVFSMEHSKTLFNKCKSEHKYAYYVEGAGHNNIEVIGGQAFLLALKNFIDKCFEVSLLKEFE